MLYKLVRGLGSHTFRRKRRNITTRVGGTVDCVPEELGNQLHRFDVIKPIKKIVRRRKNA